MTEEVIVAILDAELSEETKVSMVESLKKAPSFQNILFLAAEKRATWVFKQDWNLNPNLVRDKKNMRRRYLGKS